jgi:hypothetical protein
MRIFAAKSEPLMCTCGGILVLKKHQELEAAKPRDLRHPRSHIPSLDIGQYLP